MPGGKNIIVVKPTKELQEVLYSLNYKSMPANDCIDAIRKAIRFNPDLILSDIDVPNLNGVSMARILGMLQINVPIILTSFVRKFREQALDNDNVIGFIPNATTYSEDEKAKLKRVFEAIINDGHERKLPETAYRYRFRQHEWANLLGISRRKKILVIEDNPSMKTLVMRRLDASGNYDLYSAEDGLEGLCKALLINPDLIVTDIRMPTLDGMAMSQIFYIINKPFPIVFLTIIDDENSRTKAEKVAGVLGYMHKKVLKDGSGFVSEVEKYIEKADALKGSREEIYQKGEGEALGKTSEMPF